MAKRELSSTLRNLKFMQRAFLKEEAIAKEEKEVPQVDGQFSSVNVSKKCIIIMEGDPHPGAIKGRMSFLSFNPSVDKLNGEASDSHQPDGSSMKSETVIDRSNGSPQNEHETSELGKSNIDEGLKRKQVEEDNEAHHPDKSQKNFQDSSPQNNGGLQKQKKKEKLDWNVLRPSKFHNKKK